MLSRKSSGSFSGSPSLYDRSAFNCVIGFPLEDTRTMLETVHKKSFVHSVSTTVLILTTLKNVLSRKIFTFCKIFSLFCVFKGFLDGMVYETGSFVRLARRCMD